MAIYFHRTETDFKIRGQILLKRWIKSVLLAEKKLPGVINIILCSDDYLLGMNKQYLKHNYFTDIISFDYSESNKISGDMFISIDRVRENAASLSVEFSDELHRVIIHGILHLLGYEDKATALKKQMRQMEDHYLSQFPAA
ncbi:MAG: rRNA maturation RNase YbeY [Bacteroidia bacterium]|nr:rRNA maturation RNase YbeY [Bacteroidia bacterium]